MKRFEALIEDWIRCQCPCCRAANWFSCGRWDQPEDQRLHFDGVICHRCGEHWLLVEEQYCEQPPLYERGSPMPQAAAEVA